MKLVATGEKVRKQPVGSGDELTAQEEQIARLAADGLTNQEIGAQLRRHAHRRMAPAEGLRQARHQLTQAAPDDLVGQLILRRLRRFQGSLSFGDREAEFMNV